VPGAHELTAGTKRLGLIKFFSTKFFLLIYTVKNFTPFFSFFKKKRKEAKEKNLSKKSGRLAVKN
jgi:hypothetical protein